MREAKHRIDNDLIQLPLTATAATINNYKKLSKKDIFECPFCQAKLIVKSGEIKGIFFSHLHGEACEQSKQQDKAEKKYIKQIDREIESHSTLVNIIYNELVVKSKINSSMSVSYGYKSGLNLKEVPDVIVQTNGKIFAISVLTNVGINEDSKLTKQIKNRQESFVNNGLIPIWFIEKKEQSIEKDKNSIIFWDTELTISLKTKQDYKWDVFLGELINDKYFFTYYNYPVTMEELNIDVRSIYYIFEENGNILVSVQRFLKDRMIKPFRSFLLNDGYKISFAEALSIEDEFKLSSSVIEERKRNEFITHYNELLVKDREKIKELQQNVINKKQKQPITEIMTYVELTHRIKAKMGLSRTEEKELSNKFIPLMGGLKYSKVIWDLIEENNCTSFEELRKALTKHLEGV